MKKTKQVFASFCLILLCVSLLSCQTFSNFSEANADETVCFAEMDSSKRLFETLTDDNYHDVTNFSIGRFDDYNNSKKATPVVCFSFVPYELRLLDSNNAFPHTNELFAGLSIDTSITLDYLESLANTTPIRVLKPENNQADAVFTGFYKQFGIAYSFGFIHNVERNSADASIVKQTASYTFLVSPLTENNSYYLCDKTNLTVYEVKKESLSFLENTLEEWYDTSLYQRHIAFVDKIEISIKNGTTHGICGVTDLILEHRNTDQNGVALHPLEVVASATKAVLHVTARYNGGETALSNIKKYRSFYIGLLQLSLQDIVADEALQEQLKQITPDVTLRISCKCDDQQSVLTYHFFADRSVLINDVYVGKLADGQLDALIYNVGVMLSPDMTEADLLNFWNSI